MAEALEFDSQRARRGIYWRELWQFRELLLVFAQRDIAVRYRQTALGMVWVLLQPLGMMAVFTLIFGRWARLDTGPIPYHLFVLSGLVPWLFFAAVLNAASASVMNSRTLISKVYFPRLVIPLAAVGAPLADVLVSFLLLGILLVAGGTVPGAAALLVPLLLAIVVATALGVGCLIAALTVRYRDFHHLLAFLISIWMFLTPVVYPATVVPPAWRWLHTVNPMAGAIESMRAVLFGLPLDAGLVLSSALGGLVICGLGMYYFRSQEDRFADLI